MFSIDTQNTIHKLQLQGDVIESFEIKHSSSTPQLSSLPNEEIPTVFKFVLSGFV